jgi:hypothetical protein
MNTIAKRLFLVAAAVVALLALLLVVMTVEAQGECPECPMCVWPPPNCLALCGARDIDCWNACTEKQVECMRCLTNHPLCRQSVVTPVLPTLFPSESPSPPTQVPTVTLAPIELALVGNVQGTFKVTRGGETWTVSEGDFLELNQLVLLQQGDYLDTAEGAHVKIQLFDGSTIELVGESHIRLAELNQMRKSIEINLTLGDLKANVIPDPQRVFKVGTINGVIGVRGTEFEVIADGGKTLVIVSEGEVEILDLEGQLITTLSANQAYVLDKQTAQSESKTAARKSTLVSLGISAALLLVVGYILYFLFVRKRPPKG